MKLVVRYHQGSIYEGSMVTFPAEYESAEALYCAIEEAFYKAKAERKHSVIVGGYEFYVIDLTDKGDNSHDADYQKFVAPEILTVDEWFMQCLELQEKIR